MANHFQIGKEQLDRILGVEDHPHWAAIDQRLGERGGESGVGQLRAVFDIVEQLIEPDDFQGCIFVNVAMEFPLPHELVHLAAARNKQALEDIICDIATQAGAAQPRAFAQELCLVMEGAYITRLISGNPQTITIARRVAEQVIREQLGLKASADGQAM